MDNHLRLLIVEDDEQDAELVRLQLERCGFELRWERAETEAELRRLLAEQEWDLIISDFAMPRFDGLRAFEVFQETGLDTPFIFVSGALGEERAVAAMRAGARDYFLKGNLTRLDAAVRRELAEARSRAARREAEQLARQEQRRLAIAVEVSGAGVFEYHVPLDPGTYHSARWASILGYTVEEIPGYEHVSAWELEQVHPDDRQRAEAARAAFMAGHSERVAIELRLRHKAGHWVDVAIFATAVTRNARRRPLHIVGVMLDLTDRKSLEAQLRQAQKMEAVGRLAGGVAHDFNNLLTVIFNFGRFVLDGLRDEDPAREDMREILKAAERAEGLTAQLLAFSRRKAVSPCSIDINALVGDLDRMLRRIVGEDIDMATTLAPDLWHVHIDPGSLEQVVLNLVVNARDAMVRGGKLTVQTENVAVDGDYGGKHGAKVPAGEYVVLAISDDGGGMDAETQRLIFEPFFTTKPPGAGTGLGLSTCYGIVKQAGGYIWVYSEVGTGTTFRVYLPRTTEPTEQRVRRPEPRSLSGTETILVAEDDDQVRSLTERALRRLDYRVLVAANGPEALARGAEPGEHVDLLLTDVVMPEMGGPDLAERLVALHPGMKVLYMSGYTANSIVHRGTPELAVHLLEKPFTAGALARRIRELLDE